MSIIEIDHSGLMTHIFAKVSFNNWTSDFEKGEIKAEWEDFKKLVDGAIKLIKSPEDKE